MYDLDAAAQPWKSIPWSSLHAVLELNWGPHEVWNSVATDSAESWRPLRTMCLSIRWPCSIILRGLPLCGWVAVIPIHLHFVIIPLTVDCGIFRSEEISRLDLLHRWHPITVPRWNSLSSWEQPILSQMFVETEILSMQILNCDFVVLFCTCDYCMSVGPGQAIPLLWPSSSLFLFFPRWMLLWAQAKVVVLTAFHLQVPWMQQQIYCHSEVPILVSGAFTYR